MPLKTEDRNGTGTKQKKNDCLLYCNMHLNFECKARVSSLIPYEEKLNTVNPKFIGLDRQTDTYFKVSNGRLKLREGNIENALIHYHREDTAAGKQSQVTLYQHQPDENLKAALAAALGVKVTVVKRRKIFFVDNVKFHFDEVDGLGFFVEIEAIDQDGSRGIKQLREQFHHFKNLLELTDEMMVAESYSDLLMVKISS